jgi:hypothetical protein
MGAGDEGQLSLLALHALGTADAVIHDPGISLQILDLVQPARYREAARPAVANERALSLARDGWRVVRLVKGNLPQRHDAIECAAQCADQGIPFHIIPTTGEPFIAEAPTALLTFCKPLLARRIDSQLSEAEPGMVVISIVGQRSGEPLGDSLAMSAPRRQAPLGFSMSGLAG